MTGSLKYCSGSVPDAYWDFIDSMDRHLAVGFDMNGRTLTAGRDDMSVIELCSRTATKLGVWAVKCEPVTLEW